MIILFAFVRFAGATENVSQFVANEFFDVCSCGFEIFSGVELFRVFVEELADSSGHGKS